MPRRPPDEMDQIIGANIRRVRLERCLSQHDLGHALGVTAQQIQKYESGQNRIAVRRLVEISAALRVPVDIFLAALQSE